MPTTATSVIQGLATDHRSPEARNHSEIRGLMNLEKRRKTVCKFSFEIFKIEKNSKFLVRFWFVNYLPT